MNGIQRLLLIVVFFFLLPHLGFCQSVQLADSLFQTGQRYDDRGNMKEAEFYYREAYNLYRQFQDTTLVLKAGKEYASALMWRSKEDQAMELYQTLLEVDHPANDTYNRGDMLNSMGLSSRRLGNTEEAEKFYRKSLPLAEQSGDSLLIGVVHSNLGSLYRIRGNYSKAIDQEKKALTYFEGLNREENISNTLSNLGRIYEKLNVYDEALEYHQQALEIRKDLGNVQLLSSSYNNVAIIQSELGNYDQALVSYQQSLKLSRQAGSPRRTANTLNNIGLLYKNLGEYDKALNYYRKSLTLKEENADPASLATTTKNIGKLLWDQGKYREAEPYYYKALELRKQTGNSFDVASSLNTMVELALKDDNYRQARQYTSEIKAIADSTGNYRIQQFAARNHGKINAQQGNHAEAVRYYKKASAYSDYLSPSKKLNSLESVARQYNKMDSDSAIIYGEQVVDLIEEQRADAGATSELRSGFFGQHTDFYAELASWMLKYKSDITRAYKLVEQSKARSLGEELAKASQNIDKKLPGEVRVIRNEKSSRINSLYTELERTVDEERRFELQDQIRMAELDFAAYENQIHNEYPEFKALDMPEPISLDHARRAVDQNTAVLEYALAGNQLLMFLISQDDVRVEQFSLPTEEELGTELTERVTDFKDAIISNASWAKLRSQSIKLYNVLIKPFEDTLDKFENLIIIPDGALAYLPFEAISQGDQYLVENFNIKYEPSLTTLTLLDKPEAVSDKELLAVAGSQISEEENNTIRSANLSALPSTIIEVDSIASHFSRASTLKDNEVSEEALKELLRQNRYRYIHMATHGIIDEEHPNRSGLALSAVGEITPSSKEDGLLRTSEIFGMDINSDMVVLSACNTGLGKTVDGEGMLGMQRSFFYAGTSTVVASLWNVYDRSTAVFMNEFYKSLINSDAEESWTTSLLRWIGWDESVPFGQKASAMREAKLQMIKHPLFNHPIYWAPFIVVGR